MNKHESTSKIETDSYIEHMPASGGEEVGGGGIEQKEKRTPGHGQQ